MISASVMKQLNKYIVLGTELFQKSEKKNRGFMLEGFDFTCEVEGVFFIRILNF